MILKFFKGNSIYALICMLLIALGMVFPVNHNAYYPMMFFFENDLLFFNQNYLFISAIMASLLIAGQAFYLSRLNFRYIFIEGATYLPSFFYILITSSLYFFSGLNNALIANSILLFVFNRYFISDKVGIYIGDYFEGSFLFFIAFLIYPEIIFIFPFFLLVIIILRSFNWREWLTGFLGFFIPLSFLATVFFTFDIPFDYQKIITVLKGSYNLNLQLSYDLYALAIPLLILFVSILYSIYKQNVRKIVTRKYFSLFIYFILYILVINYLAPGYNAGFLYALAIPASYLLAYFFISVRTGFFINLLFVFFIISLLFFRYFKIAVAS